MKIQLDSDLHLEYLAKRFPGERLITPHPDADVLVLAGDIASGTDAIVLFRDWPVPVIYVIGNRTCTVTASMTSWLASALQRKAQTSATWSAIPSSLAAFDFSAAACGPTTN